MSLETEWTPKIELHHRNGCDPKSETRLDGSKSHGEYEQYAWSMFYFPIIVCVLVQWVIRDIDGPLGNLKAHATYQLVMKYYRATNTALVLYRYWKAI